MARSVAGRAGDGRLASTCFVVGRARDGCSTVVRSAANRAGDGHIGVACSSIAKFRMRVSLEQDRGDKWGEEVGD